MENKFFVFISSSFFLYFFFIFIFGESGIIDSNKKSKEILVIKEKILQLKIEIESMEKIYYHLASMEQPDEYFFAEQGKVNENIMVFKVDGMPNVTTANDLTFVSNDNIFAFICLTVLVFLLVLLFGLAGIYLINFKYNYLYKKEIYR